MSSTEKISIFLVEDEDRLRRLVHQFLTDEGFEVAEAADGGEAIALYRAGGPYDVVLLDLNLPVCSGVEVCRQIKRIDPAQRVVICSAAVVEAHEKELVALGVTRFLTKPYHPDELIHQIQEEIAAGDDPSRMIAATAGSL